MAEQRIPRVRLAHLVSLVGAAILAACGGGGAPPADNADSRALAAPASVSIRYAVGETSQRTLTGAPNRQLNVVDTSTGQVVWQTTLDASYLGWTISSAHQIDADGQGVQYQGPRQLYYIQGGKVYQLDISAGTLLQSQRISSVTNACHVMPETHSVTTDGLHSWLAVETAGPNGNCDLDTDNEVVMVFANMPTTEVGPTYAPHSAIIAESLPDANGQSKGMLTLDATGQNLVVRSNDLKRDLYTVLNGLTPGQPIYALTLLPTQKQMALIQVGTELRVVDWRSSTATVGAPIATLSSATQWPILTQDGQTVYIADGLRILAISGAGTATTWHTLPVGMGSIAGLWLTTHAVVALQTETTSSTPNPSGPLSTLWAIDKSTRSQRTLDTGPTIYDGWVTATEGDTVFYAVRQQTTSNLLNLLKINAQGGTSQPVATSVNLVSSVLSPHVRGYIEVTKLLWCEPQAGQTDCDGGSLVSYDVKTAQQLTLGQLSASNEAGWLADYSYLYNQDNAWEGAQNLTTSSHYFHNPDAGGADDGQTVSQTKLWLFDANQAGSFREVLTMP